MSHFLRHPRCSASFPSSASSSPQAAGVRPAAAGHRRRSLANRATRRGGETGRKNSSLPPFDFIRFPSREFEPIDSRIYIVLCAGSINIDPPFPVCGVNEAFSIPTALWRTYVSHLSLRQCNPLPHTHTYTHLNTQLDGLRSVPRMKTSHKQVK